jgi:hypothetical protein
VSGQGVSGPATEIGSYELGVEVYEHVEEFDGLCEIASVDVKVAHGDLLVKRRVARPMLH